MKRALTEDEQASIATAFDEYADAADSLCREAMRVEAINLAGEVKALHLAREQFERARLQLDTGITKLFDEIGRLRRLASKARFLLRATRRASGGGT